MVVTGLEFLSFEHITLKLRVLTGYTVVMVTFYLTQRP